MQYRFLRFPEGKSKAFTMSYDDGCRRISGHDSIWYATNIEIYNYVKAYDSLVFSADGTMVYNPTLYKIWFKTDNELHSVNSGETLYLQTEK